MATIYWLGGADAVAQVHTGSIDSVDGTPANNTFIVTIGGVAISAVGDTDVATTATNLRASLNASTHPYFSAITWSGSTGDIIGTADTAGAPFVAALTETGAGTGAVTDFAETTASAGPNDVSTADNWSGGVVPVNADDVFVDRGESLAYGLDQNAVTLSNLEIRKTFTNRIGLSSEDFATSADGETVVTTADEYRQTYWKIGADEADIGQHFGPGTPLGSPRIKFDNAKSGASTTVVHSAPRAASETGYPAVRLLAAHASANIIIRSAAQGVGIAVDLPGETSTIGTLSITDTSTATRAFTGPGVTITSWEQAGGINICQAAATMTSVSAHDGTLTLEGPFLVTTLTNNGATCYANNSAATAITTANLNAGVTDASQSEEARTWTTVVQAAGAELVRTDALTITTHTLPAGRARVIVG